ncbi:2'-5' RNA ligase family protein [Arthrobacter sp. Hor0625]|uniref:2'-5' RNA ligase family protein n=1 Tax=Arthrobacter sp. Hor0625 TaxID=3457358 RepID=UPI00403EB13A
MRNLIVVAFVEPVAAGMEFPREDWPLHITLVKFDVVDPPPGDPGPPGDGDPLAARVAGLMDAPIGAALGSAVTIGAEAGFGRRGTIPVSLVEPSPALQTLHEALVEAARSLPGRISTPGYTGSGYRPHVSHRPGKTLRAGERLALDRIALVDMAPDGGHATRRVLRLWDATS